MKKSSHAVVPASVETPTPEQMKEFWLQVSRGQITKDILQKWLRGGKKTSLEIEEVFLVFGDKTYPVALKDEPLVVQIAALQERGLITFDQFLLPRFDDGKYCWEPQKCSRRTTSVLQLAQWQCPLEAGRGVVMDFISGCGYELADGWELMGFIRSQPASLRLWTTWHIHCLGSLGKDNSGGALSLCYERSYGQTPWFDALYSRILDKNYILVRAKNES